MFTLSVKQMAINEVEKIYKKLEAIDINHNGIPDVLEAKADILAGIADLEKLEAEVTPAELATALNLLFPGKFNAAQVAAGEAAVAKVFGGIQKAATVAAQIPAAVKE